MRWERCGANGAAARVIFQSSPPLLCSHCQLFQLKSQNFSKRCWCHRCHCFSGNKSSFEGAGCLATECSWWILCFYHCSSCKLVVSHVVNTHVSGRAVLMIIISSSHCSASAFLQRENIMWTHTLIVALYETQKKKNCITFNWNNHDNLFMLFCLFEEHHNSFQCASAELQKENAFWLQRL